MSESPTLVSSAALSVSAVTAGYGDHTVLQEVDLEIPAGLITTIIGPNGCGKSTLLRVLGRLLPARDGAVRLADSDLGSLGRRELARRLATLPQNPVAPEGLTVADLVARGRQPHQPWYRQWSSEDERLTVEAMESTGVGSLSDRALDELSGGQRQRAWIAMVLAQQAEVLLLDEPTTHLDLAHAVEVLELVARLRREADRTVVTVLHDLNLAARYSDHLVVMHEGRVVAHGTPARILTPDLLRDVFELEARVFADPADGTPTIAPTSHA